MKKPSLFGKYLLLERLNVGGMAEVFVAKAFGVEGFERILAIKKILPTMAEDEEFITMFIDEARISVQLTHANIVHIHELGRHDDAYYIAMEYVSGKDLRALLERFRRRGELMPTAMAVFVATRICEGLDYAHRRRDGRGQELKIIHRDVSPQNILLSYEGEVKIIDFGIAKAANRSQKTQAGILKGKFGYMSPEQVRGMEIDHRSDIFAMGVIMYEMLTGEKLFVGESDFSTLEKVRNADVVSPRKLNPEIPPGLEKVVLKALAREVEDRYQWASDLQEDLMRFLLAGDAIYSSKHLATFMKEAFAEDVARESEKMERFGQVDRPDQMEPSGIITSLPSTPKPSVPKRPAARPSPLPSISAPRPGSGGRPKLSPAGAPAVGQPRSATLNIPPPTLEELAEMDGSRDRTIIVSEGVGFFDNELKTLIGALPAVGAGAAARPLGPPTQTSQPAVDATVLRSSAVATSFGGLNADTGHDLRPIEMTGFHPAHEDEAVDPTPAGEVPRNRPRLVIGDAPVSAPTTIGPSPFAHQETREFDEGVDPSSGEYDSEQGPGLADDLYQTSRDHLAIREDREVELEDENPTRPPPSKRAQRKLPPRATAKPASGRRGLLIAIAATGIVALLVLGAALVKFFVGGAKSGIVFAPSPRSVRFSVTVKPGDKVFNESAKQVEFDPGDYVLDVRPSSPDVYSAFRMQVKIREGKMGVVALDFKAHLRSTEVGLAAPVPSEGRAPSGPLKAPEAAGAEAPPPPPPPPPGGLAVKADDSQPASGNEPKRLGKADPQPDSPQGSATAARPVERPPSEPVRPPPEERRPPPPTSNWSATVFIDEPGVDLFVDGRLAGTSPKVQLSNLAFGRTYVGQAKKAGFEIINVPLENPERKASITQEVQMLREERGDARSTKKRERSPVAERQPVPERTDRAPSAEPSKGGPAKGVGKLICTSDPVDAEVIIDGKATGRRTPVPRSQPIELPFGKHKVVFRREGKSSPAHEVVIGEEQQDSPFLVKALKGEL